MKQVAEAAGVSLNTVSLALRNHRRISVKTRQHVQQVAENLGYRPDPVVAAGMARLRVHQPDNIGGTLLILHQQSEENLFHWARSASAVCQFATVCASAWLPGQEVSH